MLTFRHLPAISGLVSLLLSGCGKQPTAESPLNPDTPALKVAVLADGRLTVDGKACSIDELRASLEVLRVKHGVIWYYRESGPQKSAMDVMKVVLGAQLPIRLSSRPDYSDSINSDVRPITK
jgi:hypothetical protein